MRLYRSRSDTMIHKPDCRYAINAAPWFWAVGKPEDEVARVCAFFGYEPCVACDPVSTHMIAAHTEQAQRGRNR